MFSDYFKLEKSPRRGLFAAEWVMVGYMVFTLLFMLFLGDRLHNPEQMLWGRLRVVVITAALWAIYRMLPCRITRFLRIAGQLALLSWWYPDTYELNRHLPNLDHIFAQWEQDLFGFQPSLRFCQALPWPVVSELMDLGYAVYFPMIALTVLYFFLFRYKEFHRATFVILASFYIYYLIFVLLPVTGPQYYYRAIGLDAVAEGKFADVGHYFETQREPLESPGYKDGIFYGLVVDAHEAGERPTAAFPSSHVGISTILMLLLWRARARRLLLGLTPFYVLLCLSTVYIYAHYAIDVLAGWASALLFFLILEAVYKGKELKI